VIIFDEAAQLDEEIWCVGTLAYSYDRVADVMTIEGVKYSGELLRQLGVIPVGSLIRVVGRQDGVLTLRVVIDKTKEDEEHERERGTVQPRGDDPA